MKYDRQSTFYKKQNGAALIVTLILLGIMTMVGVSSSKKSTTEMKMASGVRERSTAFEAAEAALARVEQDLASNPPRIEDLRSVCAGNGCFNPTCENGLCFDGEYLPGDDEYYCRVAHYANVAERVDFWSDTTLNVWQTAGRHKKISIDAVNTDVKYIIEFLCYVKKDELTDFDEQLSNRNNGAPLFRITAYSESNSGKSKVALQSTYKVLAGQ